MEDGAASGKLIGYFRETGNSCDYMDKKRARAEITLALAVNDA